MEETYFVIYNGEGDTTVTEFTKAELLAEIEDERWGDRLCLGDIPDNNDTNYWGESLLIIKGKIVTPDPVEVVRKYDID